MILFQLTIEASDGRGGSATAFVTIEILRNPDDVAPVFTNLDIDDIYRATILFNINVNTVVSTRPDLFDSDQQVTYLDSLLI